LVYDAHHIFTDIDHSNIDSDAESVATTTTIPEVPCGFEEARNEPEEMDVEPDELDYDAEGEYQDVSMAGKYKSTHA
jgi:hypothetical protein